MNERASANTPHMEVTLDELKHSPAGLREAVEVEIRRSGSPAGGVRVSPQLLRAATPEELRRSPEAIRLAASMGSDPRNSSLMLVVMPARAEGSPLGVRLSDVHGLDKPPTVTGLLRDGPAASCLRIGDVLEEVNGLSTVGSYTVGPVADLMRSGSELAFKVMRPRAPPSVVQQRLNQTLPAPSNLKRVQPRGGRLLFGEPTRPPHPRPSSPLEFWKRRQQSSPEPMTRASPPGVRLRAVGTPTASPEGKRNRSVSPSRMQMRSRTVPVETPADPLSADVERDATLGTPTDSASSTNATPSVTPSNRQQPPPAAASEAGSPASSSDDGKTFFSLASEQSHASDASQLRAPTALRRATANSARGSDDGSAADLAGD